MDLVDVGLAAAGFAGVGLAGAFFTSGAGAAGVGLGLGGVGLGVGFLAGAFTTGLGVGVGVGFGTGLGTGFGTGLGSGFATGLGSGLGGGGGAGSGFATGCGSGVGAGAASSTGPASGACAVEGVAGERVLLVSAMSSTRLTSMVSCLIGGAVGALNRPKDSIASSSICPTPAADKPILSLRSTGPAYSALSEPALTSVTTLFASPPVCAVLTSATLSSPARLSSPMTNITRS